MQTTIEEWLSKGYSSVGDTTMRNCEVCGQSTLLTLHCYRCGQVLCWDCLAPGADIYYCKACIKIIENEKAVVVERKGYHGDGI